MNLARLTTLLVISIAVTVLVAAEYLGVVWLVGGPVLIGVLDLAERIFRPRAGSTEAEHQQSWM